MIEKKLLNQENNAYFMHLYCIYLVKTTLVNAYAKMQLRAYNIDINLFKY